ncbi:RHS repeat-associated core domain-containing protein [Bacillales bacterium AN1005]
MDNNISHFLFDDWHVVNELDETEQAYYIRGHEWLTQLDDQGHMAYYVNNIHGDVTHLTGQQGQILNAYTYDAFGNMLSAREQRGNPFRYAGEMQDALTGHYYLRARFYNPQIARFTQEDTYRGDGLNLYAYVANNPIRYVDPSGYMCQDKGNVYKSPGEILRDKYNDLSPSERTARMNILAEENAYRILLQMENSMPRSHFVERHGAQTTLQAQFNRANQGINPTTGVIETRRGRVVLPSAATRFFTHRDQLTIIERSQTIFERNSDLDLASRLDLATRPITFNYDIGEGYQRGTLAYGVSKTGQVFYNINTLQPVTAFPIWGR